MAPFSFAIMHTFIVCVRNDGAHNFGDATQITRFEKQRRWRQQWLSCGKCLASIYQSIDLMYVGTVQLFRKKLKLVKHARRKLGGHVQQQIQIPNV